MLLMGWFDTLVIDLLFAELGWTVVLVEAGARPDIVQDDALCLSGVVLGGRDGGFNNGLLLGGEPFRRHTFVVDFGPWVPRWQPLVF